MNYNFNPDKYIYKLKILLLNADTPIINTSNFKVWDVSPMKAQEGGFKSFIRKYIVTISIDGLGYACVSVEKFNLELI